LESVELKSVIGHVFNLLQPEARVRGIELVAPDCKTLPPFLADPVRLTQAMLNLVINAMQAVDKNGRIEIVITRIERDLSIEVRDSGPGIPAPDLARIRVRYWSFDPTAWATWSSSLAPFDTCGPSTPITRTSNRWLITGAPRAWIALGGVGYGALHYLGQGKGWTYHLYPFAVFLCALAGAALGRIPEAARALAGPRSALLRRLAALVLTVMARRTLQVNGREIVDSSRWAERRVTALAGQLAAIVPAGGRVQVMDTTGGGIHALFRLGIREPTRFIYDFHFFHHTDDPRILALRRELAAGLEAAPPAAIVIFRNDWLRNRYDRIDELPAVASLLERHYTLAVEGDGYRIHAKRSGS
jgi:hypothetical protein